MSAHTYSVEQVSNLAIQFAYDGSDFAGYAKQNGQLTVQGELERALGSIFGSQWVSSSVAGRTDKGVHALCQIVSVALSGVVSLDTSKVAKSLERLTPSSISIRRVVSVNEEFHARFSAVLRKYRYLISIAEFEIPQLRRFSWNIGSNFDPGLFGEAAAYLVGEHDFSSFCRKDPNGGSLVRRVEEVTLFDLGEGIFGFDIVANAFCHQMVRSIVGYLVQVGCGSKEPKDFAEFLDSRHRMSGVDLAPPRGLYLIDVEYSKPFDSIVEKQTFGAGVKLFVSRR